MAFDSTFWVAIAFLVFIIAVFKPLRKATAGALDDKIAQIRREVEEAQRLREEAQSTLASYQLKQRDAGQEAQLMMEQAKSEAEAHRKSAKIALEAMSDGFMQQDTRPAWPKNHGKLSSGRRHRFQVNQCLA